MSSPPIKAASGVVEKFLRSNGYGGITLPPRGIFILAERMGEAGLIAHETVHWDQDQRMGLFKFYSTYFRETLKHGYKDNAMEVEARDKSGAV